MHRPTSIFARQAFTLVELLVVIGVIGTLIGLLLPALSSARKSSAQVVCMANLREWTMAATLHVNANRGYLPRRGQGVQPTKQIDRPADWFNALPPLVKQRPYSERAAAADIVRPDGARSIWLCPASLPFVGDDYWSYGMNMALSVENQAQNNGMPDKMTGLGPTSVLVFMADAPGNYAAVFPSKTAGGYNPVARHKGKVNIAFLDGHVAAFDAAYAGIGIGRPLPKANTSTTEKFDLRWHPPGSTWDSAQ